MSIETKITTIDGNVFADLGFAPKDAAMKDKSQQIISNELLPVRRQRLDIEKDIMASLITQHSDANDLVRHADLAVTAADMSIDRLRHP